MIRQVPLLRHDACSTLARLLKFALRVGIAGIKFGSVGEVRDRQIELPLVSEDHAKHQMSVGKIRMGARDLLQGGNGLGQLVALSHGPCKAVTGFDI